MDKEIWKDIAGYEKMYQVSNLGRVRSLDRYSWNGYKYWLQRGKILKPCQQKSGYLNVDLSDGHSKSHKYRVHRLVAQAFIPNPNNYPQVNHKDEDKSNNKVENLEWCTAKYNLNYGHHNKKAANTRMKNGFEKIAIKNGRMVSKPVIQLTLDGKIIKYYNSQSEAARKNNIKSGGISDCCNKKIKYYKGYLWEFA